MTLHPQAHALGEVNGGAIGQRYVEEDSLAREAAPDVGQQQGPGPGVRQTWTDLPSPGAGSGQDKAAHAAIATDQARAIRLLSIESFDLFAAIGGGDAPVQGN